MFRPLAGRASGGAAPNTTADFARYLATKRSVLDAVRADVSAFQRTIGTLEKARIDEYLSNLRQLEASLATLTSPTQAPSCTTPTAPMASTDLRLISRAHSDLTVMALSCGLSRVVTISWGGRDGDYPIRFVTPVSGQWHLSSHARTGSNDWQFMVQLNN